MAHTDELIAIIEKSITALTTDEASEALEEAGIANARLCPPRSSPAIPSSRLAAGGAKCTLQAGTSTRFCRQSGQPAKHPS
jgi:crotonobetainyl-CoA:carnitine CoA-transferase CaiB-like acyl-CoA transferase